MKYGHIVSYVASQMWAIEPNKFNELLAVLAFRASGQAFTADEIRARIGDSRGPSSSSQNGNIAIIPVRGVIANRMGSMDDSSGGTSCERIGAMIDQVAADPSISTIVYDFDTPGGTVAGLQALADKMFALRGKVTQIAMVNGLCASAGYWLASQCDEIVSDIDGETGSIGVRWTPHQDISAALAKEGIVVTEIAVGKYKTEGSPFVPLSDETKAFKLAQAQAVYDEFTASVARGRKTTPAAVEAGYGEGRVLLAKDAKAAGLIDRIGTMDETIGRLIGRQPAVTGMRADVADDHMRRLLL
jgi:signal peptide peptidase SppA